MNRALPASGGFVGAGLRRQRRALHRRPPCLELREVAASRRARGPRPQSRSTSAASRRCRASSATSKRSPRMSSAASPLSLPATKRTSGSVSTRRKLGGDGSVPAPREPGAARRSVALRRTAAAVAICSAHAAGSTEALDAEPQCHFLPERRARMRPRDDREPRLPRLTRGALRASRGVCEQRVRDAREVRARREPPTAPRRASRRDPRGSAAPAAARLRSRSRRAEVDASKLRETLTSVRAPVQGDESSKAALFRVSPDRFVAGILH